jgi:hypothetical protein
MDNVNVTLITRENKRKIVSVEGKLISIEGYPYQFCVHRSPESSGYPWRVSECSTGCFFAAGNSPEEAIFNAGKRLTQHGIDNLNKSVNEWKDKLDKMEVDG